MLGFLAIILAILLVFLAGYLAGKYNEQNTCRELKTCQTLRRFPLSLPEHYNREA